MVSPPLRSGTISPDKRPLQKLFPCDAPHKLLLVRHLPGQDHLASPEAQFPRTLQQPFEHLVPRGGGQRTNRRQTLTRQAVHDNHRLQAAFRQADLSVPISKRRGKIDDCQRPRGDRKISK